MPLHIKRANTWHARICRVHDTCGMHAVHCTGARVQTRARSRGGTCFAGQGGCAMDAHTCMHACVRACGFGVLKARMPPSPLSSLLHIAFFLFSLPPLLPPSLCVSVLVCLSTCLSSSVGLSVRLLFVQISTCRT